MRAEDQTTYIQHVDGFLRADNTLAGDLAAIKRVLHAERLSVVHVNPRVVMLLDADAQARLLPLNPEATAVQKRCLPDAPPVRGNAVLDWTENYPPGTLPEAEPA